MIRKGDVLVRKTGEKQKVMDVLGGLYAMSSEHDHDSLQSWWDEKNLMKCFDLPKEKWRPSHKEKFFFIDSYTKVYENTMAKGNDLDMVLANIGNCFRTREEAEAKAEEVRALLAK